MSFKKRLYISLLLMAVLPVLVISASVFFGAFNTILNTQKEWLLSDVINTGSRVDLYMTAAWRGVEARANLPLYKRFVEGYKTDNSERYAEERGELYDRMEFWISDNEEYEGAFILDADGTVILSTYTGHEGSSYKNTALYTQPVNRGDGFVYSQSSAAHETDSVISGAFVFSSLIAPDGNAKPGVLVLVSRMDLFEHITKNMAMPDSGVLYLIDPNGVFLFHSEYQLIGEQTPLVELEALIHDINLGKAERSGFVDYDYLGVKRMAAYSFLPSGYMLGLRVNNADLYSSVFSFFVIIALVLAGILVVVLIVTRSLSKHLMSPVKKLQKAFHAVGAGGVYKPITVEGPLEFALLTESFNTMVGLVNEKQEAMEAAYSEVKQKEDTLRRHNNMLKLERDRSNFLINRDPVSGVYSRIYFERIATEALKSGQPGAVIFIDIDSFKNINDSFSHEFGDNCLAKLGSVLMSPEFEHDAVARIGGDEFMILKYGLKNEIEDTAARIYNQLQKPFIIQNVSVMLTGSIGIAMFPQDGTTVAALLKNADLAMFQAKAWGKNQFCFYDNNMSKELQTHMDILDMLRVAHLSGDAYLAYQPQQELSTGKTVAFEALCRAKSEKLGFVSPADFIPLAESSGLIVPLGEWILKNACMFARSLADSGTDFGYISVNVSQVQLQQENFVDYIFDTLNEVGLPPHMLQLEITESVLATSTNLVIKKLKKLKSRGILIALDDFGTGFSSLNYLVKLPIDTVKIDKSFVDNICVDENTQIMCRTIIDLGHKLKYKIVAEGAETEDQVEMLGSMGCDLMQGYYFSRPIEADKVSAFVKTNNTK